jgi:hypothetical protein
MYKVNSEELRSELNFCLEKISSDKWKYLHVLSIYNCIKHINSIKSKMEKDECYHLIKDIIREIQSIESDFEIDIAFSNHLYNTYFIALQNIYQKRLNFEIAFSFRFGLLFMLLFILIEIFLFFWIKPLFYLAILITICWVINVIIKKKKHKLIGYGY